MKETKLTCPVVRDLLPLDHDRVVEEETAALVEAHLTDCPDCQGNLARLRGALPEVAAPVDNRAGAELVRREKKLSTCWAVVITLVAGFFVLLILASFCGLDGPMARINPELIEVTAVRIGAETEYGQQLELDYILRGKHFGSGRVGTTFNSGGVVAVEVMEPLFSFYRGRTRENVPESIGCGDDRYQPEDITVITINGEVVWTAEKGIIDRHS